MSDTDASHAQRIKEAVQALNAAIAKAADDGIEVDVSVEKVFSHDDPAVRIVSVRILKQL